MSTELSRIHEPLDVQVRRAQLMADAGELLPRQYRGNPAALLVAFEYADAIGIPRVNALTSIHIVDGKPAASADLIGALVRRAGHKLRVTGDETYAEAVIIRADDPDFVPDPIRWDEARARKAGLWGKKGPWQQYPGAMMRSRAITEAARMWAADALYGVIYSPEELGGIATVDGTLVEAAPSASAPMPAPDRVDAAPPPKIPSSLAERIATADDVEWLTKTRAYLDRFAESEPETVADLQALADAQIATLEAATADPADPVQETIDGEVVA